MPTRTILEREAALRGEEDGELKTEVLSTAFSKAGFVLTWVMVFIWTACFWSWMIVREQRRLIEAQNISQHYR